MKEAKKELEQTDTVIEKITGKQPVFVRAPYGELPVDTSRPDPVDNNLTIGAEAAGNVKTMLQWILPVLILLGGVLLLFRRKGK